MLTVGIDESVTHGESPILCVAACIASADGWTRFRGAWLPHAMKYAAKGGYHATKAHDPDNLILAGLMEELLPSAAFAIRISCADMRAVVSHNIRSEYGDEYTILVWTGIRFLSKLCDLQGVDWLAYVLEDGHKGRKGTAKIKQMFNAIKQEAPGTQMRYHVYSDTWVGKEELITHPADLISYEWARAHGRPEESEILAAFRRADYLLKDYTRDALEEAVRDTESFERAYKAGQNFLRRERRRERKGKGKE